jgi:hypothetical protein
MKITVSDVVELAKEAEKENPLLWEHLNLDQDAAYRVIASEIFDMMKKIENEDEKILTMLVALVLSQMENYVLNVKIGLMN